jgi:hypothetical protein
MLTSSLFFDQYRRMDEPSLSLQTETQRERENDMTIRPARTGGLAVTESVKEAAHLAMGIIILLINLIIAIMIWFTFDQSQPIIFGLAVVALGAQIVVFAV